MIERMMGPCVRMERSTAGTSLGDVEQYAPGEAFRAYLRKDASPEIRVAERQGMKEQYTVVVPKGVTLKRDDVFRRESDGLTFRCTSSTTDGEAPERASVRIAKCGAERWDIP